MKTVVTCVYCGHEYPDGTPTAKAALLTDHIKVCAKHPMRKAELTIEKLRDALIRLTGSGDIAELKQMESVLGAIVTLQGENSEAAPSLNAIRVLIETTPEVRE